MIYKFPLSSGNKPTTLILPTGSIPRYVGEQKGWICLWVEMGTGKPDTSFIFDIFGTGWDLPNLYQAYIGTVQIDGYVWHVYQV